MKYIGGIITSYIVLLVLDIMQRRNHKRTQSLKKFTVRQLPDLLTIQGSEHVLPLSQS